MSEYLMQNGWRPAGRTVEGNLQRWRDSADPLAAPRVESEAIAVQLKRSAGPVPPPPEMIRTADLPADAIAVIPLIWPRRYDGAVRAQTVVCLATAVPAIVQRLGLTSDELFTPNQGTMTGKPVIVLGDPDVIGGDHGGPAYGPAASYSLSAIYDLTKAFAAPKKELTERDRREAMAKQAREEKQKEDAERYRRTEAENKARDLAARQASPLFRIKQLEEKLGTLLGEPKPQP
jgi:hypothetical protein